MAGDGRKRPCSGVRRIALSATAVTRARPPTPGATGRTPRSRGFSSGIYCGAVLGLVTVLAVVDLNSGTLATGGELTVLERLIVRGRCQARCNELFGYQERQRQIDLFDHYMPFMCVKGNHFNCTQCSRACVSDSDNPTTCKQQCRSQVCRDSCDFLHDAFVEESEVPRHPSVPARNLPPAAKRLVVTKPTAICTYTHIQSLTPSPRSLVRVYWNVRDVTNVSTSVPLTFIMAIQNCSDVSDCPKPSKWDFFGQTTNFSVIPIYDLAPNTTYVIRVLAVHWSGYIRGSVVSNLITTPPSREKLGTPVDLAVSSQYVRAGHLRAVVSWRAPPVSGGCFFRLYSMPPKGTYEMMEIKYWGQLKYELRHLMFNSNYTIQVYNSDEHFLMYSDPANITFHTLDSCLEATDYDYNICPPEKPANLKLSVSPPYLLNGSEQQVCDVLVSWDPPRYRRYRNFVSNYSLSFRKAPDMHNADVIQPHRGTVYLPASATNYTLRKCHWDGIYEVTMRAQSRGGRSEEVTVSVTLGNGYAEYYDNADPEVEDKAVLYATMAPALLGVVAVVVCCVYRWRISRSKSLLLGESLRREEINPIYECAVTKEEAELPVPDEYEIDYAALTFTEAIGEGAFGKVLKAELDLSLAPIGGRSTGKKTVAVKVLKEHATPDERRNLLLEIEAMKQLGQHQNIVSIIACVACSHRPCLVMHYCPMGDLRTFLRNHRKKTSRENSRSAQTSTSSGRRSQLNSGDSGISYASKSSNSHKIRETSSLLMDELYGAVGGVSSQGETVSTDGSDNSSALFSGGDQQTVSQTKLLSFARQIAMGMEYLAERKFIHRDLAARNILLYNHRQLKISDFGLARDVYETSMYQPTSARKLPYKWMPIESIFDQVFTIKSDVWSFGIVLWEIVTLGGCPYPGIPNKDLFRLLKEGYRMEKPENCSLEIYKMMLSCWHPRPEDRPSFTELRNTLERSLEKAQSYIDLSVAISEDYYKQDSESSGNNVSTPFGSARLSDGDYRDLDGQNSAGLPQSNGVVSAAADVHVCHLFHNNSSDKNFTLRLAESVTLEAPPTDPDPDPDLTPRATPSRRAGRVGEGGPDNTAPWHASVLTGELREEEEEEEEAEEMDEEKEEEETKFRLALTCSSSEKTAQHETVRRSDSAEEEALEGEGKGEEGDDEEEEEEDDGDEDEDEDEDALTRKGVHSAPLLPTSPRSASGSSSTELTCDCDSPDNLSDTSASSGRSSHVKVHHAPSLTYGILSFFRAGKGGPPARKMQGRHKRHSRSLTDVNGLEIEMEFPQPSCAYDQRTDAWACAL